MAQVVTKFITNDAVTDLKARLRNNQPLRSRNAADSADINIIKVNASDVPEFSVQAQSPFTPAANNDIANKLYVDNAVAAFNPADFKNSCRVATVTNDTLSGLAARNGVTPVGGDRVLVTAQTTASANGIYVAASGAWARATDADASSEVTAMMMVGVSEGTLYAGSFWYLSTFDPIVLGTTALTFARVAAIANKENLTLNGTDITNQYKDLAFTIRANTLNLSVAGVQQYEGTDYSLSVVSGVTRVTFLGDLATGGGAALVSGDILRVQYSY